MNPSAFTKLSDTYIIEDLLLIAKQMLVSVPPICNLFISLLEASSFWLEDYTEVFQITQVITLA